MNPSSQIKYNLPLRRAPFGDAFAGVRVVEAADSFPGRLCGKLLADAGADVVTIVTPRADGVEGPFAAGWSAYLDLGKRSSGLSAMSPDDRDAVDELLRDADLFVTSSLHHGDDAGLACPAVLARHPQLTAACVTPFGQDGPNHGYLADDVVLCALAGLADATPGFPDHRDRDDEPPVQSLAPFGEMVGGLSAAVAVFAALLARLRGSDGPRHVESASLEANVAAMIWEWGLTAYGGGIRGRRPRRADLAPNCYLPCRDGMVVLVAFTEAHWNGLVDLMERPDWALDPRFADPIARSQSWDLLEPRLRSWAARQSGRDVLEAAQARGLPCCCTFELGELLGAEQVRHNGSVTNHEGRPVPANPIVVTMAERGSDVDTRPSEPEIGPTSTAPLAGIRVLDLGQAVAGPYAAQLLAALGAEVTLVEPPGVPTSRRFAPFAGTPTHDASNTFNHVNRGKTSVQLDLTTDAGQDVLRSLVADSDVVLENFSARAARRLHLSFAELSAIRPDLVLASISAFGRSGPWGNYVALHSGVLTLGGVADITRDEEGRMRLPGAVYPDLVTANWTALAITEALAARLVHGRGCHVQISMLDVLLNSMAGLLPSAAVGNRDWRHPASFLPAADGFVAVSDDVPAEVRAAVAGATKAEAMVELQRRGFHAGAVLDIGEVMTDPHLARRGFVLADDHPVTAPRPVPAVPWKLDGQRPELRHAPLLGEATEAVLARVAGRTTGVRS